MVNHLNKIAFPYYPDPDFIAQALNYLIQMSIESQQRISDDSLPFNKRAFFIENCIIKLKAPRGAGHTTAIKKLHKLYNLLVVTNDIDRIQKYPFPAITLAYEEFSRFWGHDDINVVIFDSIEPDFDDIETCMRFHTLSTPFVLGIVN